MKDGCKLPGALHARAVRRDLFEQVHVIGPRCSVAEEDVVELKGLRHRGQPLFVLLGQDGAVPFESAAGCDDGSGFEEQTVAVAAHAGQVERDQAVGSADGIERALQMVAEIDDLLDRA